MCVCVCECATCGRVKRFTANQLQLRSFAALIASGSSSCRATLCKTLPGTLLTLRRQPKTENENKISRTWTLDGPAEELLCDLAKILGIYHERFVRRFSLVLALSEGEWGLPGHVCIAHFLLQSKLMCWPFNYTTNKQTAEKLFTSYSKKSRPRKKFIDCFKGSTATGNWTNYVTRSRFIF